MKDYSLPRKDQVIPKPRKKETIKAKSDIPPVVRYFFPVFALLLALKLVYHLPDYISRPPQTINIHGARILSEADIRPYLNITEQTSWFSLDPYEMSLQLRKHPWIEQAVIHRSIPLIVDVHVTERVPIAFLKTADQLYLLGKDFKVLKRLSSNGSWDLPVVVNRKLEGIVPGDQLEPRDLKRAFQLMELLKKNQALPLDAVSEIIITDPFNIVLVTSPKGLRIKIGFENFSQKLASLAELMPLITKNLKRIRYIDLRAIRGAVVKYK